MSSSIRLHYEEPVRTCSCCGAAKPLSAFYMQAYTGLPTNQCKECISIKRRVERQRARTGKFVSKERQRNCEDVTYTNQDWQAAMLHFRGLCCYCGSPEGRTKDSRFDKEHFVPLSRGGHTVRSNIGPACRKCNRGRGNQKLFQWFRKQEFWDNDREQAVVKWIGIDAALEEGF